MKYLLLICIDDEQVAKLPAAEQEAIPGEYYAYTTAIRESGEWVGGDPLHGRETATTVSVRNGETVTTDGPFAETKETIAGYYVVDVADIDRAIELAAQIPGARMGKIEVRPLMDFPA